ncbi:relaxase/mobilization nuclease domain-containing protein [Rhodoferax antarcticus]|uniref:relaxase/mobilization nuclease domain-containing protein n=1 Tax=Rhodoferax antarcticus TaxID=81479 RepID=UPI000957EB80|nr:relaxase/mobilization nuclease domain-containing protein [Rhodoferax antarcticus]APW48620.1 hypothetical protein RA876_19290 [Rhodoferax antarcticus]APW48682.1 hypothetical protein RA876_19720 [Rhodoferax antarcticus]
MVPVIPNQRKFKSNAKSPFNDLVKYITKDARKITVAKELGIDGQQYEPTEPGFTDLVNYVVGDNEKNTDAHKCIAIRTHRVVDITTASAEMAATSKENTRCKDPAYHVILSWPEHENPSPEDIFEAAEHAIKALGMADHQYVLAVHGNTDNTHCHISINRVHPVTFQARHIEWAKKTLHMAARESEIKHGWSHDNGIYIVDINGHGKKTIVLNPDHNHAIANATQHAHADLGSDELLPSWHDPESLDSWLKSKVTKELKHALPRFEGWSALHAWFDDYGIELKDSGGGGMRLHATSPETGEILDIAASKGLRILKRADLEKRWGPYANSTPIPCVAHDLSHLTPEQIQKGIDHVLNRTNDGGRPPDHIIARNSELGDIPIHVFGTDDDTGIDEADQGRGLHELPTGGVDGDPEVGVGLLPGTLQNRLGDNEAGVDKTMRPKGTSHTEGASTSQRSLNRDDAKRAERKEQRAASRADLRQRFAQYKRFVNVGDTEHFERLKAVQVERSLALKQLREKRKTEKSNVKAPKLGEERLLAIIQIDADALLEKLKIESSFQEKSRSLREIRTPPLSWRAWLYEQSKLGDQAALSALRGIVYQAQRDAKAKDDRDKADELEEARADTAEYRERQYRKVMARLLKEEQEETAIRSANSQVMRPHEIDALIQRYQGMQWRVTGNGNVEYSNLDGGHLFTDRGSRVTFDRVRVTDEDIQLALVHAQNKFGNNLTLTGDDPLFTARMARLADDMGIGILNPELQVVIEKHRESKKLDLIEALSAVPAPQIDHVARTQKDAEQVMPPTEMKAEPAGQKPTPITTDTPDIESSGAERTMGWVTASGQTERTDAVHDRTAVPPATSVSQDEAEAVPLQEATVEPLPQSDSSPAVASAVENEIQPHPEFLNAYDKVVIEKAERAISKIVNDGDKNYVEILAQEVYEIEKAIKRATTGDRHTELSRVHAQLLSDSDVLPVALQDALKIALDKYRGGLGR